MTNTDILLEDLEDVLDDATSMPMTKKSLVDVDKIKTIIEDIRLNTPQETKQAKAIVDSRNNILDEAKKEAAKIISEAQGSARFGAADKEKLADLFLKAHVCDDVIDALVGRFFHRLRRNRRRVWRGVRVRRVLPLRPAGGKQQKKRKQKRTQSGRFHQKISFHQDAAVKWCSR